MVNWVWNPAIFLDRKANKKAIIAVVPLAALWGIVQGDDAAHRNEPAPLAGHRFMQHLHSGCYSLNC